MTIGLTILLTIYSLTISARTGETTIRTIEKDSIIRVLVLPPYDKIANAGVSPDTQQILETALSNKEALAVIPFPFKRLMDVPYQMVYDKKYCHPIVDKIDCDIIITTQIITDNEQKPGTWPWTYMVRVYNVRTNTQIDSIVGRDLQADNFRQDITFKIEKLIKDIQSTFKPVNAI